LRRLAYRRSSVAGLNLCLSVFLMFILNTISGEVSPIRLADVMKEVAEALNEITGLRVTDYPPENLHPPAGYVSYPESIDYDESYGRGEDRFTGLPIVLLTSSVTTTAARDMASGWSSGDGPKSVKRAMEARSWTTCDDLTVTSVEFGIERFAGGEYLAVMFKATVVGPGKED